MSKKRVRKEDYITFSAIFILFVFGFAFLFFVNNSINYEAEKQFSLSANAVSERNENSNVFADFVCNIFNCEKRGWFNRDISLSPGIPPCQINGCSTSSEYRCNPSDSTVTERCRLIYSGGQCLAWTLVEQCPAGSVCNFDNSVYPGWGGCIDNCNSNPCSNGYLCNADTGRCEPDPNVCAIGCGVGETCVSGQCVPVSCPTCDSWESCEWDSTAGDYICASNTCTSNTECSYGSFCHQGSCVGPCETLGWSEGSGCIMDPTLPLQQICGIEKTLSCDFDRFDSYGNQCTSWQVITECSGLGRTCCDPDGSWNFNRAGDGCYDNSMSPCPVLTCNPSCEVGETCKYGKCYSPEDFCGEEICGPGEECKKDVNNNDVCVLDSCNGLCNPNTEVCNPYTEQCEPFVACQADGDCGVGKRCDAHGRCVPIPPCQIDGCQSLGGTACSYLTDGEYLKECQLDSVNNCLEWTVLTPACTDTPGYECRYDGDPNSPTFGFYGCFSKCTTDPECNDPNYKACVDVGLSTPQTPSYERISCEDTNGDGCLKLVTTICSDSLVGSPDPFREICVVGECFESYCSDGFCNDVPGSDYSETCSNLDGDGDHGEGTSHECSWDCGKCDGVDECNADDVNRGDYCGRINYNSIVACEEVGGNYVEKKLVECGVNQKCGTFNGEARCLMRECTKADIDFNRIYCGQTSRNKYNIVSCYLNPQDGGYYEIVNMECPVGSHCQFERGASEPSCITENPENLNGVSIERPDYFTEQNLFSAISPSDLVGSMYAKVTPDIHVIHDYRVNGVPITSVNLPFEGNVGFEVASAKDYSSPNFGTVNGATFASTSGHYGSGTYIFEGNDNIVINYAPSFSVTDSFSIDVWVLTLATGANKVIVSNFDSNLKGYELRITPENKIRFVLAESSTVYKFVDSTTLVDGNWHHIVGTWDGGGDLGRINLYVDGVSEGSQLSQGILTTISSLPDLTIGSRPDLSVGFNGFIDDVKVYNRALSPKQINVFYLYDDRLILSDETSPGEIWQVTVTYNNGAHDVNSLTSNVFIVPSATCGDGVQDTGEECDDGNLIETDACSSSCKTTFCGDHNIQNPNGLGFGEVCDGNLNSCTTADGYLGTENCNLDCSGFDLCTAIESCGDDLCNGLEDPTTCLVDCPLPQSYCVMTNAYWNTFSATEGDVVSLTVEGSNCDGEDLSFEVWEDDLAGKDPVSVQPSDSVFSGGIAIRAWVAEYQQDGLLGINDPPEYYFEATLLSDSSNMIQSGLPFLEVDEFGTASCNDGIQNGDEIGVDCGGSCPICPICGDSIVSGGEVCDGSNLNGETCQSQGFATGDLDCSLDCMGFDTSSCIVASCNDGIQNQDETGIDCGGSVCPVCSVCGDGIIEGREQCESSNLNGETCQSRGFVGGSLNCDVNCYFDTSACRSPPSDFVSHWKFDTETSRITPDEAGVNDALVLGAILDPIGGNDGSGVYVFDGVDDSVERESFTVPTGYPFSFSLWFKSDRLHESSWYDELMGIFDSNSLKEYSLTYRNSYGAEPIIEAKVRGGSYGSLQWASNSPYAVATYNVETFWFCTTIDPTNLSNSLSVKPNTWHHVVVVFNSDYDKKLYVDGVEALCIPSTATFPLGLDKISFGRRPAVPTTYGYENPLYHFKGSINEASFYNRALTPLEVNDLYSAIPGTCYDGIQNQDEIGIDCGGNVCGACIEYCGDGIVNRNEVCDGNMLICSTSVGYAGVNVCKPTCDGFEGNFTMKSCFPIESCGDGVVNGNEVCDGYAGICTTADGYSGMQECSPTCDGYTGSCVTSEYCGDNITNGLEVCDGNYQLCNTQDIQTKTCSATCNSFEGTCIPVSVEITPAMPSVYDTYQDLIVNLNNFENMNLKSIYNWNKNNISFSKLNMLFEEGSNNTYTKDYSGYGNDGHVVGPVWNSTGGHDGFGAYEFNGNEDYIEIQDSNSLRGDRLTISAWIKSDIDLNTSTGWNWPIIQKNVQQINAVGKGYGIFYSSGLGWLRYCTGQGSNYYHCGDYDVDIEKNTWHHVAMVIECDEMLLGGCTKIKKKLYYDGQFVSSVGGADPISYPSGDPVWIGRLNAMASACEGSGNFSNYCSWEGTIDDVQIFSTNLSSQQIRMIYDDRQNMISNRGTFVGDLWKVNVTLNDGTREVGSLISNNFVIGEAQHCYNEILDTGEEQIDCGGSACIPCPTCSDGIQNGDEAGVDCGGSVCNACSSNSGTCPEANLVINGEEVYQQNILKGFVTKKSSSTSYERFRSKVDEGKVKVRITETQGDKTYLNSLSLIEIQNDEGKEAYLDIGGNAWQINGGAKLLIPERGVMDNDRSVFEITANGPEALILKGSLKQNTVDGLREYWGDEVRVQCLPGIYDFADSLPKSVVKKMVEEEVGIIIESFIGGGWESLNDGTLVLEKGEEAFVVLPKGTEKVRISYPEDSYGFESVRVVEDIEKVGIKEIKSDLSELEDIDGDYILVDYENALDLEFEVGGGGVYYFKSNGYYHYFEDLECKSVSYRWDKVLGYLGSLSS